MKTVVFMGTPDFAVPALKALYDSADYKVTLVITQQDKPVGRHQVLTPPPVKELAVSLGLRVYQPSTLKSDEAFEIISAENPDFIVVSAYGKILPKNVLDIPRYGCVNLHGSLLPEYRGAAPIQWAVINGDKKSGVTSMLMDVGLDTGDILLTREKEIGVNETAGELFDSLAGLCPELLIATLDGLVDGTVSPVPQNHDEATYVGMLNKEMALIDFSKPAAEIHNLVRGLNPWPVAKTSFAGKGLKIISTLLTGKTSALPCGTLAAEGEALFVVCGDGAMLEITRLQLEGSKAMTAADFLRGHQIAKGFVLG